MLRLSEGLGRIRAEADRLDELTEAGEACKVMRPYAQLLRRLHVAESVVDEQNLFGSGTCQVKGSCEELCAGLSDTYLAGVDNKVEVVRKSQALKVFSEAVCSVCRQANAAVRPGPDDQIQHFQVHFSGRLGPCQNGFVCATRRMRRSQFVLDFTSPGAVSHVARDRLFEEIWRESCFPDCTGRQTMRPFQCRVVLRPETKDPVEIGEDGGGTQLFAYAA